MKQRRLKLTTVGPVIISAILVLVFVIIYVISARVGSANIQEGLDDISLPVLATTSKLLFNPLYNVDVTAMSGILDPYVDGTTTVYAAVYDTKGTQVVEINKKWAPDIALSRELSVQSLNQSSIVKNEVGDYLILTKPITAGTIQIGTVEIVFDQAPLRASLGRAQTTISITLIIALIATAVLLFSLFQLAVRPLNRLAQSALEISRGNLSATIPLEGTEEITFLASALTVMVETVKNTISTLESRVAERTRNLELAAEVGRSVSQVRSLDVMLTDAAELIRKQFNLYYVQVYLTDPNQTYLNLQAGTGNVGTELLGRVHRLPLNTDSINGRAAVEKKSVVISDISTSATFKPNPLLPNTRSEMAVPLMIGNKVVGVLDMQSEQAGTLSTDILSAFEALAGQLAIAIQNANFLAEVQQARAEVGAQARRLTRANWVDYLDAIHKPEEAGYMFERNTITPFVQTGEVANNALSAPISVTGETIGSLVVEMEGQSPIARTDELLNTVARQVAQQIENLRLLDSAERFRYEAELASRRLTHEGWEDYMNTNAGAGLSYIYDLKEVRPYNQDKSQQTEGTANSLPIKVRDETIGKLIVQGLKADDSEGLELANAVAGRLGAHLESLRLSKQTEQALTATRKQALREQALRQITSVVRGSTDPTTILRSAARELGNILGRQTIVRLATQGSAPAADQENEPIPPAESPNAVGGDK